MRLAAHCSESRPWTEGADFGICQTFAASPAEPGELPCWLVSKCPRRRRPYPLTDLVYAIFWKLIRGSTTSPHSTEFSCGMYVNIRKAPLQAGAKSAFSKAA